MVELYQYIGGVRCMSESFHSHVGIEVEAVLKISGGTLRRWCIELEKQGYSFVKGKNDQRFFSEHDIVVLRRIRDLIQHKRLTVNDAINTVISLLDEEARTIAVRDKQQDDQQQLDTSIGRLEYQEIIERLDKQEQFNKVLIEKLEEQQRYIDNSINRRDEQLMFAIRQSMETQKQLAIAETIEKEQAKPWWKRLFNK
jgi:hypothetical protein